MSVIGSNVLAGASGGAGAAGYEIERSLRFNSGDSAYLNRTASAGNRKTWTWSGWIKLADLSGQSFIFGANGGFQVYYSASKIYLDGDASVSSSNYWTLTTERVIRDPSAWYHLVFVHDTTQSAANDRFKIYLNGGQITNFTINTRTNFIENYEGHVNNNVEHRIGRQPDSSTVYSNLYLAEVHFVDGQALAQSDFGEFDATTGVWNPKEFAGSYGQGFTTSQATGALPIYNTTGDYGAVKGSGTRTDSSSSAIELAVAMDGTNGGTTFTDEHATIKGSGSAVALTAVGNVQTVTSQNKFYGSSASFDGNGDYLSFTNIDLQRSNFTYEAWVYATDTTKLLPTVIFTAGFSSGVIHSFGLANSSGAINAVFGASTRPGSGNSYFQAPAITANKWTHIAWERDGTIISIYVNGQIQTLDTTNGGNGGRDEVTNVSYIGTNASNEDFSGYIQDARVYSTDKYNSNSFTVAGISNSFYLNFADNSSTTSGSNAGIGKDQSGSGNYWNSTNIDPVVTNNGVNIDVTSTPFTDIGSGITVTNPDAGTAVSTVTAATNSFNLTTVADVGAAGTFKVGPTTIPTNYTIDYYFRTSSTQSSNAKALYSRNSGDNFAPVDDWTNGTTSTQRRVRLHDGTGHTDYAYTVTDNAWNHVRITKTNIWVNGTSITSSPRDIGGIAVREFELGGDTGYEIDGEFGPFRMVAKDLGAPPAGGLVANSDGTLPNEGAPNPDTDSFIDTPTNYESDSDNNGGNYATLNPLLKPSGATLANGNLEFTSSSNYQTGLSTIGMSSGKWYFEASVTAFGTDAIIGIASDLGSAADYFPGSSSSPNSFGYEAAVPYLYPTNTSGYNTYTTGDTIGVAYDADNGKIYFAKNGVWGNSSNPANGTNPAFSGITNGPHFFAVSAGTNGAWVTNFGQRPFTHTPPTGFKSLCTQNLEDPTIADGSKYFDIALDTGANILSSTKALCGGNANFLWIKDRANDSTNHHLIDIVRDAQLDGTPYLISNDTDDEATLGTYSAPSGNSVGWAWNAGTSNTSISAGSLNSSLYDNSRTWSSGTSTNPSQGSWANVFANTFSTSWADTTDAWVVNTSATLNFNPALPTGAIQVYATASGTSAVDCYVSFSDGTNTYTTGNLEGVNHGWVDVASGSSLSGITSVTINSGSNAQGLSLKAIRVAGKDLVNSSVSLPNVPSIASTVRANQTAGFSIVSYTGNGTAGSTIGHNLNSKPGLILLKSRDTQTSNQSWTVHHSAIAPTHNLVLNSAVGKNTTGSWNDTLPNSSTFTVGSAQVVNTDTKRYIAYCFAPVEGYSKFGSYEGGGTNNFIYTGFRPAFVLIKEADNTNQWFMYDHTRDPSNDVDASILWANSSNSEGTIGPGDNSSQAALDLLSNGFRITSNFTGINRSSSTFVYACFASHPFKTARAR